MNTDRNQLTLFLKVISDSAKEDYNRIYHEADSYQNEELESAKKDALAAGSAYYLQKIEEYKAQVNKEVSYAYKACNEEMFKLRENMVESIFSDAESHLLEYASTSEYLRKMTELISSAVQDTHLSGKITVFVNSSDLLLLEQEPILRDIETALDKTIKIGGFKVKSAEGVAVIDNTLDSCLLERKRLFKKRSELNIDLESL